MKNTALLFVASVALTAFSGCSSVQRNTTAADVAPTYAGKSSEELPPVAERTTTGGRWGQNLRPF